MLLIVLRKMLSNRWMVLCLLIGSILVVAMVSSIPIYTDGVLQRMLTRDLEDYQETGTFPGTYRMKGTFNYLYEGTDRWTVYNIFNDRIRHLVKDIEVPLLTPSFNVAFDNMAGFPEIQREEKPVERNIRLEAFSGFEDHISIVAGRMYDPQPQDGVYEVVVTEQAFKELGLVLDDVFLLRDRIKYLDQPIKCRVVGIFTYKDPTDVYWYQDLQTFKNSFLIDYDTFINDFMSSPTPLITSANWYYAFDYHKIVLDDVAGLAKAYENHLRWVSNYKGSLEFQMPAASIFENYAKRERELRITLWVLMVPVLLMLSFYIFMVSQLIIRHEENEIAVLKSRGASRLEIFVIYTIECLIICGVALVLGPPLGLFFCTVLGASNGFLEFVSRTALPIKLSFKAYMYSIGALLIFIVTMLIPAFLSSRVSIVQYKQKKARNFRAAFWKKYFLDVLVLGTSLYGLYRYRNNQAMLVLTGAKGADVGVDPLLFLVSTLFILGTGLVFLRIYPFIIRFVFWLGRKIWSPVFYASFIQVGRSGGQEQFLMLFLMLTLSIGIFNANAARTVNKNMEDRIRYSIGADIVLQEHWLNTSDFAPPPLGPGGAGEDESSGPPIYIEPDFYKYTKLSGVEEATKVLDRRGVVITTDIGASSRNGRLLGIIPDQFARISWFKNGLLRHHIYDYINLICDSPMACLVSSNFKEKNSALKEGDSIFLKWGENDVLELKIYAFIDYWPAYNPLKGRETGNDEVLVVANLSYIQAKTYLEPYQVWLKLKPDGNDVMVTEDIRKQDIPLSFINYSNQEIIKNKNDPMLQGTNGSLTLGFVVTMLISAIGFLIYWILSIQMRVLQFGILRAMGLSLGKVLGMLVCEQVLISGISIFIGIIIGGLTSDLYVPILQLVGSAADQVPPFEVVAFREDYVKIYIVISFILTVGLLVLARFISRIKMAQAVKLGED